MFAGFRVNRLYCYVMPTTFESGATSASRDVLTDDKVIRQLLVELKKISVNETLNMLSDTGRDTVPLLTPGVSQAQVDLIRTFLDKIFVPEMANALTRLSEKTPDRPTSPDLDEPVKSKPTPDTAETHTKPASHTSEHPRSRPLRRRKAQR